MTCPSLTCQNRQWEDLLERSSHAISLRDNAAIAHAHIPLCESSPDYTCVTVAALVKRAAMDDRTATGILHDYIRECCRRSNTGE